MGQMSSLTARRLYQSEFNEKEPDPSTSHGTKKFEKLIQRRQAAAEKLVLVHSLTSSLGAFYQFQLLSIFLGMPMHE
jgi:hypothetical protein